MTLCSYCLVALRVSMAQGEFIGVGLGVGARNGELERSSTVMLGDITVRVEEGAFWNELCRRGV